MNVRQRDEGHEAIRHAGWIVFQRVLTIGTGLAFAIIVPRLMGPDLYGRYALLISIAIWSTLTSELGFNIVMSRYIPESTAVRDEDRIRLIVGNLLVMRVGAALVLAMLYLAVSFRMVPDVAWSVHLTLASTILLSAAADSMFSVFLGLNMASRWGLHFLLRRTAILILIPAGFHLGGLGGAAWAHFGIEGSLAVLAFIWARRYIRPSCLRPRPVLLRPLLMFGFLFFLAALLQNTFRFSGEALVRILSASYEQVGLFGVAAALYAAAEASIHQFFFIFTPYLSMLYQQAGRDELLRWVDRLLAGMTLLMVPPVMAGLVLADRVIPLALGPEFATVAANIKPLCLCLLVVIPACAANMMAMVIKRPSLAITAAALRLGGFWLLGWLLVPRFGSLGACIAILAGTAVYSLFFAAQVRAAFGMVLRKWILASGLALPFCAPAFFLPQTGIRWVYVLVGTGLYFTAVLASGIVTRSDLRALWSILQKRSHPA